MQTVWLRWLCFEGWMFPDVTTMPLTLTLDKSEAQTVVDEGVAVNMVHRLRRAFPEYDWRVVPSGERPENKFLVEGRSLS
jgi:hypothetical protein